MFKYLYSHKTVGYNHSSMGLCPDTFNFGMRMHRERRERFTRQRRQSKLLVCDPGMHHGPCVTHVPWCMSGSVTHSGPPHVGVTQVLYCWSWQPTRSNIRNREVYSCWPWLATNLVFVKWYDVHQKITCTEKQQPTPELTFIIETNF